MNDLIAKIMEEISAAGDDLYAVQLRCQNEHDGRRDLNLARLKLRIETVSRLIEEVAHRARGKR